MCLGFITIFCPLNISSPTNAQAKWKFSSKTALLRICLIIDSARREKGERKKPEGKRRPRVAAGFAATGCALAPALSRPCPGEEEQGGDEGPALPRREPCTHTTLALAAPGHGDMETPGHWDTEPASRSLPCWAGITTAAHSVLLRSELFVTRTTAPACVPPGTSHGEPSTPRALTRLNPFPGTSKDPGALRLQNQPRTGQMHQNATALSSSHAALRERATSTAKHSCFHTKRLLPGTQPLPQTPITSTQ